MTNTTAAVAIVECLLKRKGGSQITMADGAVIDFQPDALDRHVARIFNQDHLARLLQIPEGYRLLGVAAADPIFGAVGPTETGPTVIAQPRAKGPAAIAPDPVGQVVTSNLTATPASVSTATQVDTSAAAAAVGGQSIVNSTNPLAGMTVEQLKEVFKAEIGRVPSPKSKPETMIAQIEAFREERGTK